MILRAIFGFALLVVVVALGARVSRLRSEGRRPWRGIARSIDRTTGILAIALLALLALTALQLLT